MRMPVGLILIVLTGVATLAGCQPQPQPPYARSTEMVSDTNHINITTSKALWPYLEYDVPSVRPASGSWPMRVSVPVRSRVDRGRLKVTYRFDFLDEQGRVLPGESAAQTAELQPLLEHHFKATAPTLGAVNWQLRVSAAP